MAKQIAFGLLEGRLGNVTYYRQNGEYLARLCRPVSKAFLNKLKTAPMYAKFRNNWAEFGTAGKAGKLLRTALAPELEPVSFRQLVTRLSSQLLKVMKTDPVNMHGARTVKDGDVRLLQGFDFNETAKLGSILYSGTVAKFDRDSGFLSLSIGSVVPKVQLKPAKGTTHVRLFAVGLSINFEEECFERMVSEPIELLCGSAKTHELGFSFSIKPGSKNVLMLLLNLKQFCEENKELKPLRNGAYDALNIIGIDPK